MTLSVRESTAPGPRQLLEQVRKAVPAAQGLVVTTVPRGGLQVMQPATVSDSLVKAYSATLHTEDRLTWQTILKHKPQRLGDAWNAKELESTGYFREWLQPMGLSHAVAVPLWPLLRRVMATHSTTTRNIGLAMLRVARSGYAKRHLENVDIDGIAESVLAGS